MTVSSTTNRKTYTGDAVTTSFSTSPVVFFDTSDLTVYVVVTATGVTETLTENTHYTVTGGSGAVGTVNLAGGSAPYGAPAATKKIIIVREVPATQETDFANNDTSDAEVVEDALDRLTMLAQQNEAKLNRSLHQPDSDPTDIGDMPNYVDRASLYLAFDANGDPVATAGTTSSYVVTPFMETVLDDATAAAARTTLGVPSTTEAVLQSLADAKGDRIIATAADTFAKSTAPSNGKVSVANSAATNGWSDVAALSKVIYGLTYANNGSDATNDIDIATGGAMDATGAYWMTLASALTKRSDAAWAVGTNAGWLDTGAVGNSDYYIWLIARSDTGVVDSLCSLSSTAPTMPANYDYKRLIGWFKRVGGTIVAFHTYETDGGGLELAWDVPTLDVNLANTLTTSRRTDAVKVPLNFSTIAHLNAVASDGTLTEIQVNCPDQTDAAPSQTVAPLANLFTTSGVAIGQQMKIRTSSAGLVASRATTATVDQYSLVTVGFEWARRN